MKLLNIFVTISLLLIATLSEARVNFIEQWKSGIDTNILKKNEYNLAINMAVATDERYKDTFDLPVSFTYSPLDNFEFGTSLGIASYGKETGISDLKVGMKYRFIKEEPGNEQPSIAGEFGFLLPTADYRKNLGTGGTGINLNWLIQKTVKDIKGHLMIGYEIHTENPAGEKPGNEFQWILGGEYLLKKGINVYGELKGINHGLTAVNGQTISDSTFQELYLAPGIKYSNSDLFDFYFSPLIGMTDDSYNFILFFGMEIKI